jgi:predicted lipoprotein with Yx(FWY)xxD motif
MPAQGSSAFHETTPPAAMELTPNWKPLEAKLPASACAEFMWMYRENGVEYFKHIGTRLYLLLKADGQCVVRTGNGIKEADFEGEWQRVSGRNGGEEDNGGE